MPPADQSPPPLLDTPHIWRTLGEHGAEIRALKEADAAHVVMLEKLAERVEQVQAHLQEQDGAMSQIQAGIAALREGTERARDAHRTTLNAIKIAAVSTVLSSVLGLLVFAAEHALVH